MQAPLLIIIFLISGLSFSALAETQEQTVAAEKSPWHPELELGYRSKSGNDNEQVLNVRLALSYEKDRQRHSGEAKVYLKNEDGEKDESEQNYQLQSDYKLTEDVYAYANFKGIDSDYTAYFRDYTFSTGLGYQFLNNETWLVEAELGPGYRHQKPNTDEIDSDDLILPERVKEMIGRANLHVAWQLSEPFRLSNQFTVVSGKSNTRIDSETSLSYDMNQYVALKLTHSIQYISRVPSGLRNTDRLFYINLLFDFGD